MIGTPSNERQRRPKIRPEFQMMLDLGCARDEIYEITDEREFRHILGKSIPPSRSAAIEGAPERAPASEHHGPPDNDGCSAQIIAQMTATGIEAPPDRIIADGRIHRFASTPCRKSTTGWYIVHPDPVAPVWSFGDWRLGIKERGEGDPGRVLEPGEIAARKDRLQDLRIKVAADEQRFHAGAAIEARQRWDQCPPATAEHGYLRAKGIDPCDARVDGDSLVIPMRDITGKIWSLQEIAPDGRKHNQ
jgi:hypothetical protein